MFAAWLNAIETADFIRAVQTNNSTAVAETLSFDGLVLGAAYRF